MQIKYICKDVHTVQSGDTLYTISQNYNVHLGLLMRVNRIINPYNLRIGVKLCIPVLADEMPMPEILPEPMPEAPPILMPENRPPMQRPSSVGGTVYTIARGDTLYMIAKKRGISLKQIMDANPDIDPYNMMVGDRISIPK